MRRLRKFFRREDKWLVSSRSQFDFTKFTSLGIAVVVGDVCGSAHRSRSFQQRLNYHFGQREMDEQLHLLLSVGRLCSAQLDMTRVCVFGWSYGGYASLMALARFPSVYRAAIAGAPVTDWTLYDTGYTERYLGVDAKSKAYADASAVNLAAAMPDEPGRLLVFHGIRDENVHLANTLRMAGALIAAEKPYETQLYPNERHGLRQPTNGDHMNATMLCFLRRAMRATN